ncbi:MAG: TRAP transporter large permease subunit [Ignavibacteriae bacterium]|nr:TRAP transporter large permease subunit [Ignavibacteria bacterium]MBI3364675.1 TRAP transporter large permease subunit [Ignavibacteriota bacterium]
METLLIALLLIALAFLGSPLFSIIGAVALLAFSAEGIDTSAIIVELYRLSSASTLIAIPLFTFAGYVLAESKTPQRLVALSQAFFGWIPGGLAVVALVSCAIFTAFTGASGVTIIALGGLLYPILIQEKYSERFSLGLLTTSGSLGLLFPPSLPLILYSMVASNAGTAAGSVPDVSVHKLFAAGLIPGLLLVIILSTYAVRHGIRAKVPQVPFSWNNVWTSAKAAAWEIPLPFIILGGIYGGYFTATEAAAITAFYVLVVEVFIYRDLKLFTDIPRVMRESMVLVGAIIVILGCAMGLTNYLIDQEVPVKLFALIQQFISSKAVFLVLLNIFLLIVGMMMDIFSAIIVVVPLIIPIATAYHVDPLHLGIIFLTNLEIGYLTPPVGLNLFIASYRFEKPVATVVKATLPYIGLLLLALIFITYVPDLSLWLVRALNLR